MKLPCSGLVRLRLHKGVLALQEEVRAIRTKPSLSPKTSTVPDTGSRISTTLRNFDSSSGPYSFQPSQHPAISADSVRRDFAAATEPEAAHHKACDPDRLKHRALAVAQAAAQLAPDRREYAGEARGAANEAVDEARANVRRHPAGGSGFIAGRARP